MHRTWVLAFVLACGGSSKPATTPSSTPAPAADRCATAADHVVDLMSQVAKDAPPEKVKHFKDSFVTHCQNDKWTAEMQSCVIDAKGQEDFERCDSFMTPAQKQALGGEDGDEGGGGPPPPAPPPPGAAAPKAVMPAPAPDSKKSRSPVKKSGDPCEGGE